MYPVHRLETPPPASRFRRPWSPEPFNPNPPQASGDLGDYHINSGGYARAQRDPSDVSVEALDLADYARTLARDQPRTREAVVFQPYDSYPPSPQARHPFSGFDSYAPTPALSPASSSHSHSHSGASTRSPGRSSRGQRRPFSLPTPQLAHYPSFQSRATASNTSHRYDPDDPLLTPPAADPDAEIDIAQFPRFTRHWYNAGPKDGALDQARLDPDVFDPSYGTHNPNKFASIPPGYGPPHLGSHTSHSSRDNLAVPWGNASAEGPPLDAEVKEERIRMLEREFGGKNTKPEEEEERLIGSVDSKGHLITGGPKKRAATRWFQVLFALLAGGSSIYAAVIIKNPTPPPPASKPQAYVLYVLSVVTFLLTCYMFLIYPWCCTQRKRKGLDTPFTEGPGGMMVLPVPGGQNNGKKKKGKKGKGQGGEGVQVNLIVDPGMFGGNMREEEEEEEEFSDEEHTVPGTYSSSGRSRGRRRGPKHKRRSVFAGLALEAQWKQARKMLKRGMLVDGVMLVAWGAEFVYILIGKRCPAGAFNGWCDAYNVATAASCFLCFLFALSIFFDVKDLHSSNTSPRTRTHR
ncbi:hypothetical protein BDW22DRAFT_1020963 [Trametopsis cervina]|nr:hypothetical protein BDW22DRAFT_1020963 [Trametopsis cervina]